MLLLTYGPIGFLFRRAAASNRACYHFTKSAQIPVVVRQCAVRRLVPKVGTL